MFANLQQGRLYFTPKIPQYNNYRLFIGKQSFLWELVNQVIL